MDQIAEYYPLIKQEQDRANAWSAAQAQKAMDYQTEMSNTAHQREVADLKAAGLNPVLSAGGSGATTGSGIAATAGNDNVSALYGLVKQSIDAVNRKEELDATARIAEAEAKAKKVSDDSNATINQLKKELEKANSALAKAYQQAEKSKNSAKAISGSSGYYNPVSNSNDFSTGSNFWDGVVDLAADFIYRKTGIKQDHTKQFLTSIAPYLRDDSLEKLGTMIDEEGIKGLGKWIWDESIWNVLAKQGYTPKNLVKKAAEKLSNVVDNISEGFKRATGYYGDHATTSHFGESNSDSKVRRNRSRYSEPTQLYN